MFLFRAVLVTVVSALFACASYADDSLGENEAESVEAASSSARIAGKENRLRRAKELAISQLLNRLPIGLCQQEVFQKCFLIDNTRCQTTLEPVNSLCVKRMKERYPEFIENNLDTFLADYKECLIVSHAATSSKKRLEETLNCVDEHPVDWKKAVSDAKR